MQYRTLVPSTAFREHLECVWMLEDASAAPGAAETIVPDGCAELIFHLGERFSGGLPGALARQPEAVMVGPLSGPFQVASPGGRISTIGVRFRPGGLRAFVDAPLNELAETAVDARCLHGPATSRLAEALSEARSDRERLLRIEGFLRGRFRRPTPESAWVREILATRGRVRSDALARAAGVSLRQLERRFRAAVGLSPKRLSRIVRFQEVLRRTGNEAVDWVSVALDCGYFDQAHLVRDFRELAGSAPSRFGGRDGFAGHFIAPQRLDAFFGA